MKRMKALRNAADAQANALCGAVLSQLRQDAHGMKAIQVRLDQFAHLSRASDRSV
jgi:hypothetical protein